MSRRHLLRRNCRPRNRRNLRKNRLQNRLNRLFHVHINDNYRLWDDDMIVGSVHTLEYLEFLYWLRRTGYEGWMTIDQYPYREDGRDAVAESAAWLHALEQRVECMDPESIRAVLQKKDAIAASRLMRGILFPEEAK